MKATKKYQRVYLEWIDSTQEKRCWIEFTEIEKKDFRIEHQKIISIAYLIKTTKLEYVLSGSIFFEQGKPTSAGTIFSIPKGCVTKFEYLEK